MTGKAIAVLIGQLLGQLPINDRACDAVDLAAGQPTVDHNEQEGIENAGLHGHDAAERRLRDDPL